MYQAAGMLWAINSSMFKGPRCQLQHLTKTIKNISWNSFTSTSEGEVVGEEEGTLNGVGIIIQEVILKHLKSFLLQLMMSLHINSRCQGLPHIGGLVPVL